MGFLLPSMTQEKLDKERDVVKNEPPGEWWTTCPTARRMRRSARPSIPQASLSTYAGIASMADLSAAGPGDVGSFFRTYYAPDNAILCVAGDFDPARVKDWIERYFGPLPRGQRPPGPKPTAPVLSASLSTSG